MSKAKHSPSQIIEASLKSYLQNQELTAQQLLKDRDNQLRLKTMAFTLRNLLSYYGYNISTEIGENSITVYAENTAIYKIQDSEFTGIKSPMSLNFNMIRHWSFILNQFYLMGLGKKEIKNGETVQTALPMAI
jgi:hypothetical protein